MPKTEDVIKDVRKALNNMFDAKPALTPREAREALKQLQLDIHVMLLTIANMESEGIPMDVRPN